MCGMKNHQDQGDDCRVHLIDPCCFCGEGRQNRVFFLCYANPSLREFLHDKKLSHGDMAELLYEEHFHSESL